MDKLKTLRADQWNFIETQADKIHKSISDGQVKGLTQVKIDGNIHKVNKVILETNGFDVYSDFYDAYNSNKYFMVSWKSNK